MNYAKILTAVCACLVIVNVQAKNKKHLKEILTLSGGKYIEVFDQDSVEQIGSILYNVNSEKIVGFVKSEDSADLRPTLKPEIMSRWLSTDPLARKYPNMSPYIFAADNPILYKDIDGRDIFIYYKDGTDAKGNDIISSYKYGTKITVPNNEFVQQSVAALDKLHGSKAIADKFNFINNSKDYHFNLQESGVTEANVQINSYKSKGKDVYAVFKDIDVNFNPKLGLQGKDDGKVLAPYGALWHELGHGYDAIKDPKGFNDRKITRFTDQSSPDFHYQNGEEKYNIQNNEWPLSDEQNMLKRDSHDGSNVKVINTESSTSSTPASATETK